MPHNQKRKKQTRTSFNNPRWDNFSFANCCTPIECFNSEFRDDNVFEDYKPSQRLASITLGGKTQEDPTKGTKPALASITLAGIISVAA